MKYFSEISGSQGGDNEDESPWDIAQCSLFEVEEHFRGAYSLLHQGDDRGSTHL
jgi:hypothetical protein